MGEVFARLFQKAAGFQRAAPFGRWPQPAEFSILQAYLGVWGPLQEKGPQGPSFYTCLSGKRPPRWGGGPAGARGGPSYLFTGSLRRFWGGFPLRWFSCIPVGWLPLEEGPPLLGFSGILPEGLSGPAPTGGTFLARASPPPCLPLWGRAGRGPPGASAGPLDPRRCRSRLAAAPGLQFRA